MHLFPNSTRSYIHHSSQDYRNRISFELQDMSSDTIFGLDYEELLAELKLAEKFRDRVKHSPVQTENNGKECVFRISFDA